MKRLMTGLVWGLVLFLPTVAYGHALSPTHYPLGTFPILLAMEREWESWPLVFLIPLAIAVEAMVLWAWMRPQVPGFSGNVWRAIVLYVIAQAFEAGAIYTCWHLGWPAGWPGASLPGSLVVCLLAGFIPAGLVGLLLYRRAGVRRGRCLLAVATAMLAGYAAAAALAFALL